ncbi:MAG: hypothetical protein LC650_02225 [Actinobacteria bacterium]|nr:hypothetical protein [Actinomycetota bacterium]
MQEEHEVYLTEVTPRSHEGWTHVRVTSDTVFNNTVLDWLHATAGAHGEDWIWNYAWADSVNADEDQSVVLTVSFASHRMSTLFVIRWSDKCV